MINILIVIFFDLYVYLFEAWFVIHLSNIKTFSLKIISLIQNKGILNTEDFIS